MIQTSTSRRKKKDSFISKSFQSFLMNLHQFNHCSSLILIWSSKWLRKTSSDLYQSSEIMELSQNLELKTKKSMWTLNGNISNLFWTFSCSWLSTKPSMFACWKDLWHILLSKIILSCSILKNPEKESILRIFFTNSTLSLFQEENLSEEPLTTVSILSSMRITNSLAQLSYSISLLQLSVDLLCLSEKNTLSSSRTSLFLFIKSKLVCFTMNNSWDVRCFSYQKIQL